MVIVLWNGILRGAYNESAKKVFLSVRNLSTALGVDRPEY
jgi:hypothetical protein